VLEKKYSSTKTEKERKMKEVKVRIAFVKCD
jgi:hypothetical protein